MAKGFKTGGRDFKPGQSGNPNGAKPLPPEVRQFRNAAKKDVIEEFKYLWSLPIEELKSIAGRFVYKSQKEEGDDDGQGGGEWVYKPGEAGEVPIIRVAIAKALLKAAQTGDIHSLNQILDRVIGKVKEELDLNHGLQDSFHSKVVDMIEKLDSKGGPVGLEETRKEENQEDEKE